MRSAWIVPAVLVLASQSPAADWPQFLGPNRDSTTPEIVKAWTEKPKELWKKEVGEAHSSPIVANGVVYAFAKVKGKEAEALSAYDAKTGELKWEKSYERPKFRPPFGEGPRGTPTFSGDSVYTIGSTGILVRWDAKSGDLKWQVDTLKEFGAKNITFGISTSPTVVGKHAILMVGGKGAGIVGFDIETGKVAWQATDDGASYASPILSGSKNPELVFLTASHVRALSADTGKETWKLPFVDKLLESSTTPVKIGELYVAGSVTVGSIALKIENGEAKQVWKNPKLTCYFSTPVAVGDDLYMVNGEATFPGGTLILRCVDSKTGDIRWEKKDVGTYHAALVKTGDGKLLMHDDRGSLQLIEPNAKEYKELAKAKLCGETWAHPAISDGALYIRDNKYLYAFELTPKAK